jgi:hypothetical protein
MTQLKTCRRCGIEKPLSEFHKRKPSKDGYAIYCKLCNNTLNRKSYRNHWQTRRNNNDSYHYKRIAVLRASIDRLKLSLGCVFCGYNKHAVVLDFHHLHVDTKVDTIAALINKKAMESRLVAEINKCVVVCSNCHRLIHNNIISAENVSPCLVSSLGLD